jgi:hypothetical protein
VHYVNAYLWERYRVAPSNHSERNRYIRQDPVLRQCSGAYDRLRDQGFRARYVRVFKMRLSRAYSLIDIELERVRSVVLAAL